MYHYASTFRRQRPSIALDFLVASFPAEQEASSMELRSDRAKVGVRRCHTYLDKLAWILSPHGRRGGPVVVTFDLPVAARCRGEQHS